MSSVPVTSIPIVRSWPRRLPVARMFIDDQLPRQHVAGYDFSCLLRYFPDGVIHLDWDVAICPDDLHTFRIRAASEPHRIRIVPYKLYPVTTRDARTVWAHHRNPVPFGCIYLPPWVLRAWEPMSDEQKLNDTTLMLWLRAHHPEAIALRAIDHDLPTVHLHY